MGDPFAGPREMMPLAGQVARNMDEYIPLAREPIHDQYGGINVQAMNKIGWELERLRPDVPKPHELGNIDIHALTKSIQSGIHGEVRMALDTLATVTVTGPESFPQLQINLVWSEDLVEALVDCAQEAVEQLADAAPDESDDIVLTPYQDVVRQTNIERTKLRDVPVFGSPEYQLERAVERLICITTIFRNLSCGAPDNNKNAECLADETVVNFLCMAISYLGTKKMLLRTPRDTLDFMKDVVVLLSNIAASIELQGREDAFCLLQFLLAFAPTPQPNLDDEQLWFRRYEPAQQPYYPIAVDALAKLLARDEPNRTLFRHLFADEPPDLLTKAFALAVASMPERVEEHQMQQFYTLVDARKPCVMQGLLAADILASLAPGQETGVTRAWLESGSGFAQNLHFLIRSLSRQVESNRQQEEFIQRQQQQRGPLPPQQQQIKAHQQRVRLEHNSDLIYMVTLAVSMLKRLTEKARDPNADPSADTTGIPPGVLPSREAVLELFSMKSGEWRERGMLANILALTSLED